jgi:hypothetical protein
MSRRSPPKDIVRAQEAQTARGYRGALKRLNPRMPDATVEYLVDRRFHPERLLGHPSPFIQGLAARRGPACASLKGHELRKDAPRF